MNHSNTWKGIRPEARTHLETRSYARAPLAEAMATTGVQVSELITEREALSESWIPGVELFSRRVFQQKGRGYFSELTRTNEGVLKDIGLEPQQYASALMHRDSAKGFHIHPPHIPDEYSAEDWFKKCFLDEPENVALRNYDLEQWDVMFFLTSICEMILVDERAGMPRRVMRFIIAGDSHSSPDNAAVVIPPGVAHALRGIGNEDLIMAYGTSTSFNPEWEGRISSDVELAPLAESWDDYLNLLDSY
ncbi:MAG: hypothetical protein ACSHX0_09315 [Akkermansiaceae bacterium]